ncbi:hypothetical protein FV226_22050 [Methylobacterium sp. WL12]|uniref:hypothetical protein n=1 Tax=Methylobacterium sp. WL12 TaxID=2603890 RepID=UPI0011C8040D|nr:hypothetical protein [Methylobacterium sp. WL12]TXM67409.1 hypothetical protein FV226_22050 [Methylobacterium sp. WL12]
MQQIAIFSLILTYVAIPAYAQDATTRNLSPPLRVKSDAIQKPEAKPEPEIKKQTDLDTFQLASAHREQA